MNSSLVIAVEGSTGLKIMWTSGDSRYLDDAVERSRKWWYVLRVTN